MFSANRLQGILAGVNGAIMIVVPDAENVASRVLTSLLAMCVTYLIGQLIQDATGIELKKKVETEAQRRNLRPNFEWESPTTREANKQKYRNDDELD